MKTNRDELLKNAYRLFAQMNYESASYAHLTQATGLTKAGMAYLGLSFEQSFFSGLEVAALRASFLRLYDLLKAD